MKYVHAYTESSQFLLPGDYVAYINVTETEASSQYILTIRQRGDYQAPHAAMVLPEEELKKLCESVLDYMKQKSPPSE